MNDLAVGLAEAIATLRAELTTALASGVNEPVQFRLGPVELLVSLDVKRDVGASGGVKFWVVSLEGKGQQSQAALYRIKLSLQRVSPEGANIQVDSPQACGRGSDQDVAPFSSWNTGGSPKSGRSGARVRAGLAPAI